MVKPWHSIPSQTSPATFVMSSPTAARNTRGAPNSLAPGLKNGVISVCS